MGGVDDHQIDILRLAWSRELGLPDHALADPGVRHVRIDETTDRILFVTIAGASALVGPGWAVHRAQQHDDDELVRGRGLLALAKDHGGRCAGPVALGWAPDFGKNIGIEDPLVSHDRDHVVALESLCPPDDVTEADLTGKSTWFTLVDDEHRPLASAGYSEWQGIVAGMGALTVPSVRRRGLGVTAAQLATNDALDAGLIPQWRAHHDNVASRRLAARLGYTDFGTHLSIAVTTSTV